MHVTTYTNDKSSFSSDGPITTFTYVGKGGNEPQDCTATGEDGVRSLTEEQRALLEVIRRASLLLEGQYERAWQQILVQKAGWPEVEVATKALLIQLADEFRTCTGDTLLPSPDAVVKPPPTDGTRPSEPAP